MRLIRGGASDLGVFLGLRRVLVPLHVVVLRVMFRGSAMRFGCALVVIGRFSMGLTGHENSLVVREFSGLPLAASIVFAASTFVVFSELD